MKKLFMILPGGKRELIVESSNPMKIMDWINWLSSQHPAATFVIEPQ